VARDVQHVVDAAQDPEVSVVVALGAVAGGRTLGETASVADPGGAAAWRD